MENGVRNFTFDEEIRDGFLVSEKRKKIWFYELELYKAFDKICKKYNLTYYFSDGTLLGAVRHHGFIPWDDDLDFYMPRQDYERFLKVAQEELDDGLFVQNYKTDPGFHSYNHTKIRNSNTTAIRVKDAYKEVRFNQGIFIDLFPLDNVPEHHAGLLVLRIKLLRLILALGANYSRNFDYSLQAKVFHPLASVICKIVKADNLERYIDKLASKYNNRPAQKWGLLSCYPDSKYFYDKELFKETMEWDFENIKINIPAKYREILTKCYGDWETPVKGSSWHGGVYFDTEKPYTYYVEDLKRLNELSVDF